MVQDVSRSFDKYWNSEVAVPVSVVIEEQFTEEELQARQANLYRWVAELNDFPYPIGPTSDSVMSTMFATLAAFSSADRTTLVGSTMPFLIMSPKSSAPAS